jgi:hypothetical protein
MADECNRYDLCKTLRSGFKGKARPLIATPILPAGPQENTTAAPSGNTERS